MRKAIAIMGLILGLGVLAPVGALAETGGTDRPIKDDSSGTAVVDLATLNLVSDATGSGRTWGGQPSIWTGR